MKNVSPANLTADKNAAQGKFEVKAMRNLTPRQWKTARTISLSLLLLVIALVPSLAPVAQRKEAPVQVTGVSSRKTGDGAVVTVSADAPLTRTQTWQDAEGFHLTLPGATPGSIQGLPRGVTVRNLGRSLEIVVAVKPGAGVTVDPQSNHLNLIVPGGVDTSQGEAKPEPTSRKPRAAERAEQNLDYAPPVRQSRERRTPAEATSTKSSPSGEKDSAPSSAPSSAPVAKPTNAPVANAAIPASEGVAAPVNTNPVAPVESAPTASTVSNDSSGDGILSYIFSITGMLIVLVVSLVLFGAARWRQRTRTYIDISDGPMDETVSTNALATEEFPKRDRRKSARRKNDQALANQGAGGRQEMDQRGEGGALEKRAAVPVQPALYGAYRVDQEIGKLILGQAHRMDVISSRALDDRRAIETSLLKALNSPESGEDGRRRARQALEEYGFVARQCASLLLSYNAYDRASSARSLGEIGSQSSLPFLLEALYDAEGIVRAEAVTSLGALKMPSAIGALLDMARRHPEMPTALLSRALSSCSVECLDFFDTSMPDGLLLESGDEMPYAGEITHLGPSTPVEDLPEWFEDEELSESLARLQETDIEARASAVRRLARFQVKRSVEALTALAANDPESTVRAAAVTSLGEIEHESVFAPVIMAFADEAREVRAAAARALSRLNFDRAEGYVRLIETADSVMLRKVAQACLKAGMVGQAIDRLISEDRRLAYEAFSLLSLLAKSGETDSLIEAIGSHPEVNVRLAVIRLLGTSTKPEVATLLRQLAVRDGLPDNVRSTLMEVVYQVDQTHSV